MCSKASQKAETGFTFPSNKLSTLHPQTPSSRPMLLQTTLLSGSQAQVVGTQGQVAGIHCVGDYCRRLRGLHPTRSSAEQAHPSYTFLGVYIHISLFSIFIFFLYTCACNPQLRMIMPGQCCSVAWAGARTAQDRRVSLGLGFYTLYNAVMSSVRERVKILEVGSDGCDLGSSCLLERVLMPRTMLRPQLSRSAASWPSNS